MNMINGYQDTETTFMTTLSQTEMRRMPHPRRLLRLRVWERQSRLQRLRRSRNLVRRRRIF